MAIYFIGKYPSLYNKLQNEKSISEYIASLESSMNEISSEMDGVMELLNELQGDYSKELRENLSNFIKETKAIYEDITEQLKKASDDVSSLSSNLGEFQSNDNDLESEKGNLENAQSQKNSLSDMQSTSAAQLLSKIQELEALINEIEDLTLDSRDKCDNNILALDSFNDGIVDLRIRMASIASMNNGISLEDIQKMTPEEKEALVAEMIAQMTAKYNTYKENYEKYYKMMTEDQEGLNSLVTLYTMIMNETDVRMDNFYFYGDVSGGLALLDFLERIENTKTKDGKTLIDCLEAYKNGESWMDSGLGELYRNSRNDNMGFTDEEYENDFLIEFNEYNSKSLDEAIDQTTNYYKNNLVPNSKLFDENYQSTLKVGVAIQGLKELQGHVKYDSYTLTDEYKNTRSDAKATEDFLDEAFGLDLSGVEYMTSDELKMLKYIYESQGSEEASQYMDSISQSLRRREGYIRASAVYYELMSGNNQGLEAVGDMLRIGGIGYGDGMGGFLDGFVDYVAPSKELTADEYAQTALLGYLSDGGTNYDKDLLLAYNIGSTAGKKTLPIILNVVKPGLGKTLETISDTGNKIESYMRADENTSYGEALLHTGVDFVFDKVVDTFGGAVDTKWFSVPKAFAKNTYKNFSDSLFGDPKEPTDVDYFGLGVDVLGDVAKDVFGDSIADQLGGYLQSNGIPQPIIDATKDSLIKPIAKAGLDIGISGGKKFANTLYETQGDFDKAQKAAVDEGYSKTSDKVSGMALDKIQDGLSSLTGRK